MPKAGVYGMDEYLHSIEFYMMQLLIPALFVCLWHHQSLLNIE